MKRRLLLTGNRACSLSYTVRQTIFSCENWELLYYLCKNYYSWISLWYLQALLLKFPYTYLLPEVFTVLYGTVIIVQTFLPPLNSVVTIVEKLTVYVSCVYLTMWKSSKQMPNYLKKYWLIMNQDNVSECSYMSTRGQLFQWDSTKRKWFH